MFSMMPGIAETSLALRRPVDDRQAVGGDRRCRAVKVRACPAHLRHQLQQFGANTRTRLDADQQDHLDAMIALTGTSHTDSRTVG
jgi:hypothetical protein